MHIQSVSDEHEKRKHKRYEGVYAEYAPVEEINERDRVKYKPCFLRNFSLGGVSLFIQEFVSDLSYICVRIYDPNCKIPIELLGGVVWSRKNVLGADESRKKYDIGIKNLIVNKEQEDRLKLMIDGIENKQLHSQYHFS